MACLLWRILSSFVRDTYRALGVLPSPLWGGVGGGGSAILSQVAPASSHRTTPTPAQRSQACAGCASLPACTDPPHKGEGADRVRRALIRSTRTIASASSASASPPSRKGGATRASLPLERIPFQRNNVLRGLARRNRLGREIVDRDGGGDGVGGGAQLARLGLGDQSLLPCLLDVADVRLVQAIAQRLRRHREREGVLEARKALVAEAVEDVDGEALARGRRVEQDLGAGPREPVGGTAAAQAQRQHQEAQEPRHRPAGEIGEDRIEARFDGGEAVFHAPRHQRQVGTLVPLLVPALEHGGEKIKLGENVAEARGE